MWINLAMCSIKLSWWRIGIACALFAGAVTAAAQGAPSSVPDPSAELQRQDRQRQELRQRLEPQPWLPSGGSEQVQALQSLPDEQPCFLIDRVRIEGTLVPEFLRASLSGPEGEDPPFGRCLGGQGITVLIQRVQQALVARGFLTSHARVPEQDLQGGELVIQINEGRLARIRSTSETVTLPRGVWALRDSEVLNLRDIEQSSENLQRLPSLHSKIQIEPGTEPGTSDLVVDLQARRPLRLGLSVDDAGVRSTGKLQGNATLNWDNPLGLGDLFYLSQGQSLGDKEAGPRGSHHQIGHYSLPWGYWLFGLTLSNNRYRQTVYGPYESYLYSGTAAQKEVSVARVIGRDASSKTTGSLKGFVRQSNNFIADLEVQVQRRRTAGWEAGLSHLHHVRLGTFNAQLAWRQGTAAGGALPAPEQALGQGTARMRLVTALLHWAMPLELGDQDFQYSTQVQSQWAQTRLTPQDRFCLGNRATVRGFDGQQTLCGNHGQLWRQELSTQVSQWFKSAPSLVSGLQGYVALDAGQAQASDSDGRYRLAGLAVGLRGQRTKQLGCALQWELFVGKPLAHPDSFTTARRTAGLSLRADF